MSYTHLLSCAAAVVIASGAASAQFLMVPDSTGDRIMLFSEADGSLVNANFINDGAGVGYDWQTPKDVIQVNNEIWVSDQLSDSITRFTTSGAFIANITGGLDNIRGMAFAQGKVYVSNSGSGNGAPGQAVIIYDTAGNFSASAAVPDPFDVHEYRGELLISNIAGDNIERYDYGLNFLGTFFDGNGTSNLDFPQQLATRSNGNLLAAGFSPPDGIYEYTPGGAQVGGALVPGTGPRGVHELLNGNIMFTTGAGVFVLNPGSGQVTQIISGVSGQYINRLIPTPSAIALAGLAGLAGLRRRR